MKRYGHLWENVVCWENLVLAACKAQRGKRDREVVQRFNFDQEQQLLALQHELADQTYRPGPFTTHWIYRPKQRLISAAPYRDRVVHHAVMNVLEPILDRHFHPDSYACRQNKGTHAAVKRLQTLMRKKAYLLQLDIRKFFPSIDHQMMKSVFRHRIKDDALLGLLDRIVDCSNPQESLVQWFNGDDLFSPLERQKGLPIGNLTSQWFANWYLDSLDHCITSRLGIGAYVRYCDDFILLSHSRKRLKEALQEISGYLENHRRLKLHLNKQAIIPVHTGVRFVGYRVRPYTVLLPKANVRAFTRRLGWMKEEYAVYRLDWDAIKIRIDSWVGHAQNADAKKLIKNLSKEWVFKRGRAVNVSCSSRRVVEQQPEQLPRGESQQEHARQSQHEQRVSCGVPALSNFRPGTVRLTDRTGAALKVLALLPCLRRHAA